MSQKAQEMAEPTFSSVSTIEADDDLPRTLRRERDAQARRARENETMGSGSGSMPTSIGPDSAPPFDQQNYDYDEFDPAPATVTRLDIPFLHLMTFFLKAVVAGIPALLLLLVIVWGIGEVVQTVFPELVQMEVLVRMPK